MYSSSQTDHKITALWNHEVYDSAQGDHISDIFTDAVTDSTLDTVDFCTMYDLGDSCNAVRDEILNGTNLTVATSEVVIDGSTYQHVTYQYTDSTGSTKEQVITLEVTEDSTGGFTLGTVSLNEECNCSMDEDCDGLITNEYLLHDLFNMFFDEYNDSTMTDETFSNKYGIPLLSTLIIERSEVISNGGAGNIRITPVYSIDGFYESVEIEYTIIVDGSVYIDTNIVDVFVTSNTTFTITEYSYSRIDGVNDEEAESTFEEYLINYMNLMMTDIQLSNLYFGEDFSNAVEGRLQFLVGNGSVEFVSVQKENDTYYGIYKETSNGVTITYAQEFTPYKGPNGNTIFDFSEKTIFEPIVTTAAETEGNSILIQFIDDLQNSNLTDVDICNKYYSEQVDCIDRLLFTSNNVYLNDITFNDGETPTWHWIYKLFQLCRTEIWSGRFKYQLFQTGHS